MRSRSTTSKRHRMRCRDCVNLYNRMLRRGEDGRPTYRFTLPRHPSKYKTAPTCPNCGSANVKSDEAARKREMAKRDLCFCASVPFRHSRGSLPACQYHPDALFSTELSVESQEKQEALWSTSRSAVDSACGTEPSNSDPDEIPF